MIHFIIIILLFLILLLASGFFVLKFFSKLAGINMFSVMAWGFGARGHKSGRLLFYFTVFIYLITVLIFFVFLYFLPKRVLDMNTNHAGGLLGYSAELNAKIYDPDERSYIDYPMLFAPLPANKFTETFAVVLLYRQPPDAYYQTTELLSPAFNIPGLIFGVIFLGIVYLLLYLLAEEYNDLHKVQKKISHRFIAGQFRKIVRLAPWQALVIFVSIFILIAGISALSVNRLVHHYNTMYGDGQKTIRSELLKKVSPKDTLVGYVISRFRNQESETDTSESADGRTHRETNYYYIYHYTVEFRDLIHVPVYLDLALHESREEVKALEKPFSGTHSALPEYVKEYAFIVNPDYSISLRTDDN